MDKLTMSSNDLTNEHIQKIIDLFPTCATESIDENGIVHQVIDFEALKRILSGYTLENEKERYSFTWPGKVQAQFLASAPTSMTLRPCRDESVNFENTKNLFIEGDNLEVLKILRETYLGKVKLIYIDPPYNTGNDFVYSDRFTISQKTYLEQSGDVDEHGNRLVLNPNSNGRFHTNWLNMMFPRLLLARDFISDDGSIFISIDDNELYNLKKVCDEIFGERNHVATVVWKRKRGRDNSAKWFSKSHEYLLIYAKHIDNFTINRIELDNTTKQAYKNPDNDPRGPWRMLGCWARGTQGGVKYDFTSKSGQYFSERLWLMSKNKLISLDSEDKLVIRGDNIYRKMFLSENEGKIPETLWDDVSNAANASDEIKKIFGSIVFDTPKPTPYIQQIIKIATGKKDVVMDFFSGSSTTAEAVIKTNIEDDGQRQFIMIQLPEECTGMNCFHDIAEIGKERIRRVGKEMNAQRRIDETSVDTGFRVFKLDSSNMNDIFYNPQNLTKDILDSLADNIKTDRSSEDLLIQAMLECGIDLSSSIEKENISGVQIFTVDHGYLVACFDLNITDDIVTMLSKRKPRYAIFRDSSLASDAVALNYSEIFKTFSPSTKTKIL